MNKFKKILGSTLAFTMLMPTMAQIAFAAPVATNVGWQDGRPGKAIYETVEGMEGYRFCLYKDGQMVYSTSGSGYDGVNYSEQLQRMHELGFGTYKFNVITTDESGDFDLDASPFSADFVYQDLPDISEVTNVQFNGYTATWDYPGDDVDYYYVDIRKNKDSNDRSSLVIGQVCYDKTFTIPEYTLNRYEEQGEKLDELYISIYAFPKQRNSYNLSKSPYYSNKGGEAVDINVNIQNEWKDNKCGENATWSYDNGVLTISGTGAANDGKSMHSVLKDMGVIPPAEVLEWHEDGGYSYQEYPGRIKSIVFEEGITEVSDGLNAVLSTYLMADSVIFPSTLTKLAFLPNADVIYSYGNGDYWAENLIKYDRVYYAPAGSKLHSIISNTDKYPKQTGDAVFTNVVEGAGGSPKVKYGYSQNGGIIQKGGNAIIDITKAGGSYRNIPQGVYKNAVNAVADANIMANIYNNYGTNITKADAVIAVCQYISKYHAMSEGTFDKIYNIDTFSKNYSDTELDTLANNCARALRHWFKPESETVYGVANGVTYGKFVNSLMSLVHDLADSRIGTDAMSKAQAIGALKNMPAYAEGDLLKYEDVALILYNLSNSDHDDIIKCSFGKDLYSTEISLTIGSVYASIDSESKESDVAPKVINGRTMLPIRFVAEALGAEVGWDGDTETVSITKGNTNIQIKIGSDKAVVNGTEQTLDSVAFVENGRTFLPVRFVSENLGAVVEWDEVTKTVSIKA